MRRAGQSTYTTWMSGRGRRYDIALTKSPDPTELLRPSINALITSHLIVCCMQLRHLVTHALIHDIEVKVIMQDAIAQRSRQMVYANTSGCNIADLVHHASIPPCALCHSHDTPQSPHIRHV